MRHKTKVFALVGFFFLLIVLFFIFKVFKKVPIDKLIKIGIIQLVEHEALDDARCGFIEELGKLGYKDNENIKINYQNAQGDQSVCNLIANKLIRDNSDLIFAISTPCAQAVSNLTKDIPILITAVTDPESANLVKSNQRPYKNVTGTSDLVPIEKQIKLITRLNNKIKKIAILYGSSEVSSKYQADIALKEAEKLGLQAQIFTASNSNDMQQITENISKNFEAVYLPTDNLTNSCMPTIYQTTMKNNIFIVCSEITIVNKGAIGTYGVVYDELGKMTARQAVKILKKESTPQNMPIEYSIDNSKLVLNWDVINKLNIKVTEDLKLESEQ
ncbi:MAG: ABC transporter substrate-binding protein [Candidatus Paraimprobicoccus trichonymphae]|uniref:ABC transporter substrate-binding protein n=1 Tax=Candidatus Paraimprobicoccus trichonymphae TaxID=3033793 RepID=A0AA48IBH4_9FIRM|nr:MAG: ABC transporter substrate-binding protein [Candidatus Paraimprobicoccus trichonymphae]